NDQRKIRDIFDHYGPGPNKGVLPNRYTADNSAVRTKSCASANQCRTQFVHAPDGTARVKHIRKHHRWTTKHLIFERHPLIDRDIILDLHPVADTHVRANDDVLANATMLPDLRMVQH